MKWRSLDESFALPGTRSLGEQLAGRKALIARYVPQAILAIHSKVIADLKESGIEQRVLPAGAKAPSFALQDQNGKTISSADLITHSRLVISFFRGRWCPFCVGQLEAMNQVLPRIAAARATLLAISPQTVQQSFFTADQHRLKFPLLSDPGNRVSRQFGLVYSVPEEQRAIYRRAFINLPWTNGDDSWELPIPATYILDRNQTILFTYADSDYAARPEPEQILRVLASG
ncbi:MAG: AhpC/TSA family protein [Acidobacteria bacterium]|nr:AhpC/TSA family protein [Acidobacteriota bacterium]